MTVPIELIVHHGGRMVFSNEGPKFVGGEAVEVVLERDYLSYFMLAKIATEDLKYEAVERMFFRTPGKSMAEGIHQIRSDADAALLGNAAGATAADATIVELFIETSGVESYVADNEDSEQEGYDGSDPEFEQSSVAADVGVIHLISDSDRTTDPEFYEAMENLGLTNRRRRVRTQYDSNGIEVDQLNEVTVDRRSPDLINQDGGPEVIGEEIGNPTEDVHNFDDSGSDAGDEREVNEYGTDSDSDDSDFRVRTGTASPVSSYRGSSQSDHVYDDKIDGEEVSSIDRQPFYDPKCDHKSLVWKEGLKFANPNEFTEAVASYSIAVGAIVKWKRSNKKNKEAICLAEGCKWRVFASWFRRNEAFVVKSVGLPHNCPRETKIPSASAKWIAKRYFSRFRIDPDLNVKHLVREIKEVHGVDVSLRVCHNAKMRAKRMLEGTLTETYAKLRAYVLQLQKVDPDGKFVLAVDPVRGKEYVLFRRIYIGFSCLKKGFHEGCRRMFGLDGCFLKGEVQGMILSAVGKDGNNQMFPIAWAIVESENRDSWNWFIEILQGELGLEDGTGWSIISDQQKGLVDALKSILPFAEHRKCARHVSANWKIKHKSAVGRKAFWDAVYANNEPKFKIHLATLKHLQDSGEDPGAYSDFVKHDPKTFCRAFVSRGPKCDSIESNICETFNGCIVKWRGLRIINMLEGIRTYMMERLVTKVAMFENTSEQLLCPRIAAKIERSKYVARNCIVNQSLQLVCECQLGDFRYVVDLGKFVCSCGYWELSGVPCVHAIAVASFLRRDIYQYVNVFFHRSYAKAAYGYGGIPAMPGHQAWLEAEGLPIRPPPGRIMPGRPRKNRRRERQELEIRPSKHKNGGTVMGKQGVAMHCRNCQKPGHNARSCKDVPLAADDGGAAAPPTTAAFRRSPRRRTREETPRSNRKCGECGATGHNKRSCIRLRGLQATVDPITSRRVREQEVRTTLNGVGVYTNPVTGNTYYRAPAGRTDADVIPTTQQTPPPGTQPTQ